MTDSLFFDSDCISAFLWVGKEQILEQLYAGRIIIPKQVYEELSYPRISHLKARTDEMITKEKAYIETISIDTIEYRQYYKLTAEPEKGTVVIGKGEAAALVLAQNRNGILASNNLKDIGSYVNQYRIKHKTTGDILAEALKYGIITEEQGNLIWERMLSRRRKIGASSFSAYLQEKYA